MTKVQIK